MEHGPTYVGYHLNVSAFSSFSVLQQYQPCLSSTPSPSLFHFFQWWVGASFRFSSLSRCQNHTQLEKAFIFFLSSLCQTLLHLHSVSVSLGFFLFSHLGYAEIIEFCLSWLVQSFCVSQAFSL